MDVELVVTPGLGDNSYLVASECEAAVIDPQRDVERTLSAGRARDIHIVSVLETHVHNDYVSGGPALARRAGAELVLPASGGYSFSARTVGEGDEVRVGSLRLVALETPGHTPEHLSWLVYDGDSDRPSAVFTGGSLMIGGAGRTDLLGPSATEELTRAQFRTLQRLATLPDDVLVFPTHGAGSFCGSGPAPKARTGTLGELRGSNAALQAPDEDTFVREQLSGLLAYPTYYRFMAPVNREGATPLEDVPEPRPVSPGEFEALMAAGAWVIDGRPRRGFAAAHVPGSVNVELRDDFASYTGWVVPFDSSLLLILPPPEREALDEALTQLRRIGFDSVPGWLTGGIDAWIDSGRAVRRYGTAAVEDLVRATGGAEGPAVLDVRQEVEWDRGHIPGSVHVFVGDLPRRMAEVPRDGEVWTICATGHRSSIAASLLDRDGIPVRLVSRGGVEDWLALDRTA
jgi:hydroxyacylglutathione hydrolase